MESVKISMKNKRIGNSVKMAGEVKPVNVSPFIKGVRYGFLILGIFYGSFRLSALRIYESRARVMRHKMMHDREQRQKIKEREESIRDIADLGKQFEVTEFPPGWDSDI